MGVGGRKGRLLSECPGLRCHLAVQKLYAGAALEVRLAAFKRPSPPDHTIVTVPTPPAKEKTGASGWAPRERSGRPWVVSGTSLQMVLFGWP